MSGGDKMVLIIEWNGFHEGITFTLDSSGEPKKFDTSARAEKWAKKNCAFEYKVVEI